MTLTNEASRCVALRSPVPMAGSEMSVVSAAGVVEAAESTFRLADRAKAG